MSAPAQIGKVAVIAERDRPVFQRLDHLDLVGVVLLFVVVQSLFLGHRTQVEVVLLARQFHELVLYLLEIGLGKFLLAEIDVVIKAVFDRRTDGQFGVRIKTEDRLGQHVRRRMPKGAFSGFVVPGVQHQRSICSQRSGHFDGLSVGRSRDDVARQAFADTAGYFIRGYSLGVFFLTPVREGYLYHVLLPLYKRYNEPANLIFFHENEKTPPPFCLLRRHFSAHFSKTQQRAEHRTNPHRKKLVFFDKQRLYTRTQKKSRKKFRDFFLLAKRHIDYCALVTTRSLMRAFLPVRARR